MSPDLDNLVNVYQIDLGEGNTSLHIAAKYRSTKILTYLLSLSDIDINAVNNGGKSAFDLFMFFFFHKKKKNKKWHYELFNLFINHPKFILNLKFFSSYLKDDLFIAGMKKYLAQNNIEGLIDYQKYQKLFKINGRLDVLEIDSYHKLMFMINISNKDVIERYWIGFLIKKFKDRLGEIKFIYTHLETRFKKINLNRFVFDDRYFGSALIYAIKINCSHKLINFLLQKGANPIFKSKGLKWNSLKMCIEKKNTDAIKCFFDNKIIIFFHV